MKPEAAKEEPASAAPVAGDVIGNTAYSERFVLKILLKLANLDTLKLELEEKSFEDDLCTLWDMTAERDVVLFLQKHDMLNLINFALPTIESPRLIEIFIGIIGNMCCQIEVVSVFLKMEGFLTQLLEFIKTDDSLVLIQLLRLVNSSLFLVDHNNVCIWMGLFKKIEYSSALYFILKNSSNKDLIVTALENINTICSYCNTDKCRVDFFTHFVTSDALDSLAAALTEIITSHRSSIQRDELERVLIISLQTTLNLVGFDKSKEVFSESKGTVATIINIMLKYYQNKIVDLKEVDSDLVDLIDSTNTIISTLKVSEICKPEKFFIPSFKIFKTLRLIVNEDLNGVSSFEEDDKEELMQFSKQIKCPLSTLLCIYLGNCSNENFSKALDLIETDYDDIVKLVKDKEIKDLVCKRAANHRTRLKENVDS
ncbi:uncharacterized protein LOC106143196 [Amyelois transitella]|uniref:uncharacterized protein LOC106143196 n=1 Tax=Amyelois transitella TaxID=680683 RepID=UPI00067BF70F|nr:uncharacterized protein LOC106143196 [Amyelois transitella]